MTNADVHRLPADQERTRSFDLYADLEESASKSWLVHRMLGMGEASAFYGAPGCGKGVLIEDMCLHIAAGWEWHGRPVNRGAVLYVALERAQLVKRRAMAFRKKHDVHDLPFAILGGVLDFRDPRIALSIANICKEVEGDTGEQLALVVVDTLSRALAGGDENSPKDMGAVVNATAVLQQKTDAHVLWVHHMPHEGDRMRGHGALLGAMDTTVRVTKTSSIRKATVVKANDSDEGESVSFTLESIVIGADGTTAPVVVPAAVGQPEPAARETKLRGNQQTVFAILHAAGAVGLTLEDLNTQAREAGIGTRRKADLTDIRNALLCKGMIRTYAERWYICND